MQMGTVVVQAATKSAWMPVLEELATAQEQAPSGGPAAGTAPSPTTATTPAPPPRAAPESSAPVPRETAGGFLERSGAYAAPTATAEGFLERSGAFAAPTTTTGVGGSLERSGSVPTAPRGLTMPRSGRLFAPASAADVCALPMHRPVQDADLQRPTVGLLLRWLRTTRGVLKVDFSHGGSPVVSIVFVDGREVRASLASASLGRALVDDELDYSIEELTKAPTLGHTMRTLHLVVDHVRALLARHTTDDIARAYPYTKDPRLVRAVMSVVEALGLSGAHTRLIKSTLDGDGTVADVIDNPIGPRTAWDVLVLLALYDGLAFTAGERRTLSAPVPTLGGLPPEAMLSKDFFSVIGLHWSAAPSEISTAYHQARQAWNGPRRPDDAALAEKIVARIEEAYRTLRDDERRRTYRRATFNLVWSHQAQLLVAQAKLALYRKDFTETARLLDAAEDMAPSPEAAQLQKALATAMSKKSS
jgi:hypothetical protein